MKVSLVILGILWGLYCAGMGLYFLRSDNYKKVKFRHHPLEAIAMILFGILFVTLAIIKLLTPA